MSTPGRRLLLVLAPGVLTYSLLQSMTVPALPMIQRVLRVDTASTAWILTTFLIAAAVSTPIAARLGDAYGKKPVLLWSLGLLVLGAVLAAMAGTLATMLIARVVQGLSAATLPLTFGIIRDEFSPRRAPTAIALISTLLAAGLAGGVILAGPLIEHLGFRWIFLVPAMTTSLALAAVLVAVPASQVATRERVPVIPALLLAAWLTLFLVGISTGPKMGWGSWQTAAYLGGAILCFVGWVCIELLARVPLVDLRIMSIRGVWSASAVSLCIGIAMYGSFGFLPQFNQTPPSQGYGFGASVAEAGYMMLPAAFSSFLCGLVAAQAARAVGVRLVVAIGCCSAAGGLAVAALAHDEVWQILVASGLSGLGSGITIACLSSVALAEVPAGRTGVAAGINANFRTIGGATGAAVMTSVLTAAQLSNGHPAEWGYTAGFCILSAVALVASALTVFIPSASSSSGS